MCNEINRLAAVGWNVFTSKALILQDIHRFILVERRFLGFGAVFECNSGVNREQMVNTGTHAASQHDNIGAISGVYPMIS